MAYMCAEVCKYQSSVRAQENKNPISNSGKLKQRKNENKEKQTNQGNQSKETKATMATKFLAD